MKARSAGAITKPAPISERDFMRQITDLAEMCGWAWVHFRPAETARGWRTPVQGPLGKGWPDLYLVRERDHRELFVELKVGSKLPTFDQSFVLDALVRAGRDVHVWWPRDFDRIAEVLR